MAASASDAHPFPIYNARFRWIFPLLDADGDPVSPSSPDTEISQDCGTFADATNEATEIATSSGVCYIDLVAGEMDTKSTTIRAQSTGAKTTIGVLNPVRLPVIRTGTAQAGASTTITLDSGASAITDYYVGCFVNITNNSPANAQGQARRITAYNGSTKVATVEGTYGTNPSSASTFEVLATAEWAWRIADLQACGGTAAPTSGGRPEVNTTHAAGTAWGSGAITSGVFASGAITATALAADCITDAKVAADVTIASVTGAVGSVTGNVGGNVSGNVTGSVGSVAAGGITSTSFAAGAITASVIATDAITAAKIADGAIDAATFASGAITAAAFAADAITDAKVAADVTIAAVTGAVGSVTGNVGGNVTGSVGSVTGSVGGNVTGSIGSLAAQAKADVNAEVGTALATYDPPTRAELTSDIASVLNILQGLVLEQGTIGSTGNDTTHVHLTGLTYGDDEINNWLLVIRDVSNDEYHARWIEDWADTGDLATVATLPFTPQNATDTYWLLPVRQDVTGGSGLDAAGVRAAIGMATANMDGQLSGISSKTTNLPTDPADASDIAASFSTVNSTLSTIAAYIDTEVAAIKAKTDNLPADPADASDIAASFSTVNSTLSTIAAYIDTEVAAIKAKTDNLPAAPAATGDIPSAAAIVAAMMAELIETGFTFKQATRIIAAAAAGKLSGAQTNTETFRSLADNADRITATVDSSGNRTGIIYNA